MGCLLCGHFPLECCEKICQENCGRRRNMKKRIASVKAMLLAVVIVALASAVFWLAVFPPMASRVLLNQHRAVQSIRNLNRAEHRYAALHPDAGFACNLSDLGEQDPQQPPGVGLVDKVLASGTKASYHFVVHCTEDREPKVLSYTITAVPVTPGTSGKYALCTDQGGEIWYSEEGSPSGCLAIHKPIEKNYR